LQFLGKIIKFTHIPDEKKGKIPTLNGKTHLNCQKWWGEFCSSLKAA
jgi:hypothetical protein